MSVDEQEDAEDRRWESFRAFNVEHGKLRRLIDRLNADLDPAHGGFAAFAGITDVRQRAVCSDLVYGSAESVAANLLEARLHSDDVARRIGATGMAMPTIGSTADEQLLHNHIQKDIAGFFRALGSTLDCLAACAIGVLAIPRSIQAADIADLDQRLPRLRASPQDQTPSQLEAWDRLLIWRNVCQVSSADCSAVVCAGGWWKGCSGGEASGEVLDVGQSHMRGLATPGPWFRRWRTRV